MNAATAFLDPAPLDLEALKAAQVAVLQELAEIGMQIVRAVRDEVLGPADPETSARPSLLGKGDPALTYSRFAKAVRQTLALQVRVAEGLETARAEEKRRRANEAQLELQHREEDVREYVAQAIAAEAERGDASEKEAERLLDALDERIEEGRYDDLLPDAPFPELIAHICADLGVSPDWRLWKDHDWGAEFLKQHTPTDIGAERWRNAEPPDDPPDDPTPDSS